MSTRTECNRTLKRIRGIIKRLQVNRANLKKQPGNNNKRIEQLNKDMEFLRELRESWEEKRVQCTD